MNILITNGRVIDPANDIDAAVDVYIASGKIVSLGSAPDNFKADKTIDATNKVVCPGFIDLNVSLREPGYEHKATIASETKAAVSAGFTTLCCSPDSHPILDTSSVAQLIIDKATAAASANVLPMGALTVGLSGKALSEMFALKQTGCVAVSQAPNNNISPRILRLALQYASTFDLLVVLKPEDAGIKGEGLVHEGAISSRLGLNGIPVSAETVAIAQAIALAEETDCRVHLTGLSTSKGIAKLARAQFEGVPITADVHAYQLHLTELDVGTFDANYHVSPPLRTSEDRDALIAGVAQGVIQVSSGHRPHEAEAKLAPFTSTEAGMSSLETTLSLMVDLVENGLLDWPQLVKSLSSQPAKTLGLNTGCFSTDAPADVTIIDPAAKWIVSDETWHSSGLNTPFWGQQMTGQVTHTLVNGHIVFEK
ncbi:MAG: dihydroorotase [Piscirickettsiaceae bacterium]|nr:MAG: dihydroorotase [Piscirickettsiaceae bacterium]PCI69987.1 MAG: dihydroorotase [Piscirickettsiaceae bacterium]